MGEIAALLFILGVPLSIALLVYAFIWRNFRQSRILAHAPLGDFARQYAANHGYAVLQADMYSSTGLARLRRYLPPGLQKLNGKPLIPLYSSTRDERGHYRSAYILRRIRNGHEMRLFVLPKFKQQDGFFRGVVYVTSEIPPTRHWLKLYREIYPIESWSDHDLESNTFNQKYELTGSNPKLLTEVFDPLLIDKLNAKTTISFLGRVRTTVVEFAEAGILTPELLDTVVELCLETEKRFVKAYPSYPEPKA